MTNNLVRSDSGEPAEKGFEKSRQLKNDPEIDQKIEDQDTSRGKKETLNSRSLPPERVLRAGSLFVDSWNQLTGGTLPPKLDLTEGSLEIGLELPDEARTTANLFTPLAVHMLEALDSRDDASDDKKVGRNEIPVRDRMRYLAQTGTARQQATSEPVRNYRPATEAEAIQSNTSETAIAEYQPNTTVSATGLALSENLDRMSLEEGILDLSRGIRLNSHNPGKLAVLLADHAGPFLEHAQLNARGEDIVDSAVRILIPVARQKSISAGVSEIVPLLRRLLSGGLYYDVEPANAGHLNVDEIASLAAIATLLSNANDGNRLIDPEKKGHYLLSRNTSGTSWPH